MSFPQVVIETGKIRDNARGVVELCKKFGVEVVGVTKGVCALPSIVDAFCQGGIRKLGDSRIQNIIAMRNNGVNGFIYLTRTPMLSEAESVVIHADGSLNSEVDCVRLLSEKAQLHQKRHKVILMVDVGDLREGVMPEDAFKAVGEIIHLPFIDFEGLGTNQGCFGATIPTFESLAVLSDIARSIEKYYGVKVGIISGGSTATLDIMRQFDPTNSVGLFNQLRIGEAILLGYDSTNAKTVTHTCNDTMMLLAEVVELKVKPSYPRGKIGRTAFGDVPVYEDKGLRRRAIVALGRQDCRIENLVPVDE
ncbi:MAG: alanine racemase, partial [Candidatus Taylorbacteria bacterium]